MLYLYLLLFGLVLLGVALVVEVCIGGLLGALLEGNSREQRGLGAASATLPPWGPAIGLLALLLASFLVWSYCF